MKLTKQQRIILKEAELTINEIPGHDLVMVSNSESALIETTNLIVHVDDLDDFINIVQHVFDIAQTYLS